MSDYPKDAAPTPASEQPASADRRRLLRAAAVSAPVVATLPSGSAFANASAYQCVINARNEDQIDIPSHIPAGPSPYLRFAATLFLVEIDSEAVPGIPDQLYLIGIPRGLPQDFYQDPRGVNQPEPPPTGADQVALGTWPDGSDVNVTQILSTADIDVLALAVADDDDRGFFIRGPWPAVRKETGEAFAVIQSCYCSVDPGTEFCKPIG
jgi:hypothetical protein